MLGSRCLRWAAIVGTLIFASISSDGQNTSAQETAGPASFKPKDGFVPDEVTAVRIGEAVLSPMYDEAKVASERPFSASLKNDVGRLSVAAPESIDPCARPVGESAEEFSAMRRASCCTARSSRTTRRTHAGIVASSTAAASARQTGGESLVGCLTYESLTKYTVS